MLERQVIEIPFTGGVDNRMPAEWADKGVFLTLRNMFHDTPGSIVPRNGWRKWPLVAGEPPIMLPSYAVGAGTTWGVGSNLAIGEARAMFSHGGAPHLIANATVGTGSVSACVLSASDAIDSYVYRGFAPELQIQRTPITMSGGLWPGDSEVVTLQSKTIHAWTVKQPGGVLSYTDILVQITDSKSGAAVRGPEPIGSVAGELTIIRAVASGNRVFVLWSQVNSPNIYCASIDVSTTCGGNWTYTTLKTNQYVTGATSYTMFDVCATSSAIYLAHADNGGTATPISVTKWSNAATPVLASTVKFACTAVTAGGMAINVNGTSGAVAYADGLDLRVATFGSSLGTPSTATVLYTMPAAISYYIRMPKMGIIAPSNGVGTGYITVNNGLSDAYRLAYSHTAFPPVNLTISHVVGCAWESKPFFRNDVPYCFLSHYPNETLDAYQHTLLVDISRDRNPWRAVANVAPGLARSNGAIGAVGLITVGTWLSGLFASDKARSAAVDGVTQDVLCTLPVVRTGVSLGLDMIHVKSMTQTRTNIGPSANGCPVPWSTCMHGDLTIIAGGTPMAFDGSQTYELGFWVPPYRPVTVTVTGSAGGPTSVGDVKYIAMFEWTDAKGRRNKSAPSLPSAAVTAFANKQISMIVEIPEFTQKRSVLLGDACVVRTIIYRNDTGVDTQYRRIGEASSTSFGTMQFTDTVATILTGAETLYHNPGTLGSPLAALSPPAFLLVCEHQTRVFGLSEDGFTIWYSGFEVYGEGAWFNPILSFVAPADVTAMASFQDQLVLFTKNETYVVTGTGPADTGGPGYADPVRVNGRVGCIDWRSVCVTDSGVYFQSQDHGIWRLDRSMVAEFVGLPVSDITLGLWVVSVVQDRVADRLLFVTDSTISVSPSRDYNTCLVYDIQNDRWSTQTHIAGLNNGQNMLQYPFVAGCIGTLDTSVYPPAPMMVDARGWLWIERADTDLNRYRDGHVSNTSLMDDFTDQTWSVHGIPLAGIMGYSRLWRVGFMFEQLGNCDTVVTLSYDQDRSSSSETIGNARTATTGDLVGPGVTAGSDNLKRVQWICPKVQRSARVGVTVKVQKANGDNWLVDGRGAGLRFIGLRFEVGAEKQWRGPVGRTGGGAT